MELQLPDKVYCRLCQVWVRKAEFKQWSGDGAYHFLCPGCDDDMVSPIAEDEYFGVEK